MKHIFIINKVAGKRDAGEEMVPLINQAAESCGIKAEIEYTAYPSHAQELAEKAAKENDAVRLYAVGGDGTLNEVFTGAYKYSNAEVAHIPCGSGNDFVRSFGEVQDFMDIETQIKGSAITIDLIQADTVPGKPDIGGIGSESHNVCASITSTGLDAEVAYNIPKYRRFPLLGGSMAYNMSILEKLLSPIGKSLKITIDGKQTKGEYLIATVCNGKTYGGGYKAAPMAKLDDGVLDVILVKKVSRLLIAKIIGKYKKGIHYKDGGIVPELQHIFQYSTAREVIIEPADKRDFILNVDGECGPAPRLYAKVLPDAARFVLPQDIYTQYIKENSGT